MDNVKYLGVVVEGDLRFRSHLKYILRNSYCALKLLHAYRHYLFFHLRKNMCERLVVSLNTHGDVAYGPRINQVDVLRTQKLCSFYFWVYADMIMFSQKINELCWSIM